MFLSPTEDVTKSPKPKPYTLISKPYPKPSTLNPKPLNPEPSSSSPTEDFLHQQGQKLEAPAEKLALDLKSMEGAPGVVGQDSHESWIPVPTLAASGGRRALYTILGSSKS